MKIRTRSIELRHSKPPIIEQIGPDWVIRTDYANTETQSGTCVVLKADGSITQLTIDADGYITDQGVVLVKRKGK